MGIGILIYLTVALGFSSKKASERRCTRVDVEILDSNKNMFISAKDIDQILAKNEFNIIGYPIQEINTLLIEQAVEKHPSIEQVNTYTSIKGRINFRILQREPIVRILQDNGDSYYIDNKGLLMPLSYNYTTRVPIATGYINKYLKDYKNQNLTLENADTLLRSIFLLSKDLKNDKYWNAMTNQLYINKKQDLVLVPKIGAKEIILGKHKDYKNDLRILTTFYTEVLPVVGWEKYNTINLQYNQQIVCK